MDQSQIDALIQNAISNAEELTETLSELIQPGVGATIRRRHFKRIDDCLREAKEFLIQIEMD